MAALFFSLSEEFAALVQEACLGIADEVFFAVVPPGIMILQRSTLAFAA